MKTAATNTGEGILCLFCKSAAKSREHVIPEWLSKRMAIRDLGFHPAHYSEVSGLEARPLVKCGSLKTKCVCQKCNNGWMSELENWAKSRFGDYVEPAVQFDHLSGLQIIRNESDLIVRWMLKTAIMVQTALPKGVMVKVVPRLYPVASGAEEPRDFFVWAAHIVKPQFNFRLLRGFPVWNGGVLEPFQVHAESMNFSIQMNHLALCLFRCPGASPVLKSYIRAGGDKRCIPMCLTVQASMPFPSVPLFPTFADFINTLEVNAEHK